MRDLISSITKDSDGYDEKYNKTVNISSMIIVVGDIFLKIIYIIHKFS